MYSCIIMTLYHVTSADDLNRVVTDKPDFVVRMRDKRDVSYSAWLHLAAGLVVC